MTAQPPPGDLLARLAAQSLDDDYATVAARRGSSPRGPLSRRGTLTAFGVAVAALSVLLTISAVQTRDTASQAEQDRQMLIDRISSEQAEVGDIRARAESLGAEIDVQRTESLQVTADAAALEDTLQDLQMVAGTIPVSGPGLRITVDDAPSGSTEGRIRDTDLQRLANGLWEAGAEAVAVGGQRLTSRSAIRTAGEAITVNYRSLSPPYVVTAVGDPQTFSADFLETSAGQLFVDLRTTFGIGFEVQASTQLTLPGRPLDVDQAQRSGAAR